MNLAVKRWKDVDNKPLGMPDVLPAHVREIGDLEDYRAEKGPWEIMTVHEYVDLQKRLEPVHAWYEAHYCDEYQEPIQSGLKYYWLKMFGPSVPKELLNAVKRK